MRRRRLLRLLYGLTGKYTHYMTTDNMKRKTRRRLLDCGLMTAILMFAACSSGIQLTGVQRGRMLVDSRYDTVSDSSGMRFLAPYKAKVDSLMSPVVGHAAHYMEASRPESDLSNLLADILMWGSRAFGEKPDFAVYNMGGIRAALSEGAVTIGNVLDVAPFENKICFLTLDGDKVEELFEQIAASGGEAVSHGVRLVITKDGKLRSALVGGKGIEKDRQYRIATLDYLAQGNDGLEAFKDKTGVVSPKSEENNVRHIIENYFREQEKNGRPVESRVEGRIVVE